MSSSAEKTQAVIGIDDKTKSREVPPGEVPLTSFEGWERLRKSGEFDESLLKALRKFLSGDDHP